MRLTLSLFAALLFAAPGFAADAPAGFDLKATAPPRRLRRRKP